MPVRVRLAAAQLPYAPGLRLHTALSGAIDALHELYLFIEDSNGVQGTGEVRANATYVSGVPEDALPGAIRALVAALDWRGGADAVLERIDAAHAHPALARAAVEGALLDLSARVRGESVAERLGSSFTPALSTNQCLFWSDDDAVFLGHAERYVAEGFRDLKVRIAIAGPERDLARLALLRERFGDGIRIAVDANGAWSAEQALDFLARAAAHDLSYIEQPTHEGDWAAFEKVGRDGPVPPMLDEGLKTAADVDRLAALGPPFLGHLKLSKAGGARPVAAAARRLADAGVGVMVGQMNEGALATALTVHCAMAAQPAHRELYGCYGLAWDPAAGVTYRDGKACVPRGAGLAITVDESRLLPLWELTV